MNWSWTPSRRHDPELMDQPGLPASEVADAYRVLGRINRQLGNLRTAERELARFLREDFPPGEARVLVGGPSGIAGAGAVTLLDVGSGSGDIPASLVARFQLRNVSLYPLVLDRDVTATGLACRRGLDAVRGDALRLPLAGQSVDLVTAVKFAHHFSGHALDRLLAEMARVARLRVLVLDIRRHWLAYWGIMAWSRLFTRNRLVRFDGPLSVLRGFTPGELQAAAAPLADFDWTVRRYAGFQLALVGRRNRLGTENDTRF